MKPSISTASARQRSGGPSPVRGRDGNADDRPRSAEIVEVDPTDGAAPGDARCFEVRYHFPSREAFKAYERDHGPRLREEGMRLFPPEKGVRYRRALGEIIRG